MDRSSRLYPVVLPPVFGKPPCTHILHQERLLELNYTVFYQDPWSTRKNQQKQGGLIIHIFKLPGFVRRGTTYECRRYWGYFDTITLHVGM